MMTENKFVEKCIAVYKAGDNLDLYISKNNGFIYINVLTRLLALGLHGKLGYLFEISMTTFSVLEHQIGRSNVLAST